jgi:hypothetical protein
MILITLAFWIVTFPIFRYEKEEPKDGDGDGLVYDGTPKERKVKATPKAKK